jgi:hypothetical protein
MKIYQLKSNNSLIGSTTIRYTRRDDLSNVIILKAEKTKRLKDYSSLEDTKNKEIASLKKSRTSFLLSSKINSSWSKNKVWGTPKHSKLKMSNFGQLTLKPVYIILIHQESRCTEKLNIVKFRAPFGEAGLHKKGQTVENCLQNVQHTSALKKPQ